MKDITSELHKILNSRKRYFFPFKSLEKEIPKNGIYIIFEKGETYGEFDRIVRVGTHTGDNQLRSRLNQHFVKENKNRSIFRKNIGRCFLNIDKNPYSQFWELDITSRSDKAKNLPILDVQFEKELESKISSYIQNNLSFCVFQIDMEKNRLFWESRIVSTLAKTGKCQPSINWLGNQSPKEKIKTSGLWQVNELNKQVLTETEFEQFKSIILS